MRAVPGLEIKLHAFKVYNHHPSFSFIHTTCIDDEIMRVVFPLCTPILDFKAQNLKVRLKINSQLNLD